MEGHDESPPLVSGEEQLLLEEEAREEAIKIQHLLYTWYSTILRSHEAFPKEEYDQAVARRQTLDKLKDILKAYSFLPEEFAERQIKFEHIRHSIPNKLLTFVWEELLEDEAIKTEEYKKFCRFSGPLLSDAEKFYQMLTYYLDIREFVFKPPSEQQVLLFELLRKCGDTEYTNETELLEKYKEVMKGKRILEVGSGPGWLLLTLKQLGAEVSGIEQNQQYKFVSDSLGLDVRFRDAKDVDSVFADKFDVIISHNFFCDSILLDKLDALTILTKLHRKLTTGGISIHMMEYIKQPEELCFLRAEGFGPSMVQQLRVYWKNASEEEREQLLRMNIPALNPVEVASLGLKDVEWREEGGDLVFSFRK